MTKQIRFKDGKVLKIESCVKCPIYWSENDLGVSCKTAISGVMTPEHKTCVSPYCPLQDWQDQPAEQSIICTASKLQGACPTCPQYATCKDPDKPTLDSRVLYRNDPAAQKEQGTKCGYLDYHALLTALNEEDSTGSLIFRINRGEFIVSMWDDYAKQLSEKDDKIDHLKDEIKKRNVIIQDHCAEIVRLTNDKSLCIQELDRFKKKYDGRVTEVVRLNDRIRQQDQELKDLGKALHEAREYDPFTCPRRQDACIGCPHTACPQRAKKEPPKDEPELWICPYADLDCEKNKCRHGTPHEHIDECDKEGAEYCGKKCIPYKKEDPTVPQMQQPACFGNGKGKRFGDESCIECGFLEKCKDVFYNQPPQKEQPIDIQQAHTAHLDPVFIGSPCVANVRCDLL